MKNLLLFSFFAFSLVFSGCGKKKTDAKKDQKSKMVSSADGSIPVYTVENDFIDEEAVSDFAFVDDEEALLEGKSAAGMPLAKDEMLALNDESAQFDRVQFEFNKNDIAADQASIVRKDATIAKKVVEEGKGIVVAGHTCQIGSASYNLALSQRRAEAVKKEMMKEGIAAEQIKTVGMGYESPLVWSDKTERSEKIEELALNRRAEVSVN